MNKKTKALIGSALAIAMSASVAAGGTFALFTDKAEVNVAITAGTVDVEAAVSDIKLYSMDRQMDGMSFENLGTVSFDKESNLLTLTNITPGDKVVFNAGFSNLSNVKTKIRTVIADSSDNAELMDGLVIKINDTEAVLNGSQYASNWIEVDPNAALTENNEMIVSIELPADKGNEYQAKSAKLRIAVEAVQWNGVSDISTADGLVEAINGASEISLSQDIDLNDQLVVTNDLTIYGGGKTITQTSTASDKAVIRLDGATEDVNIKLEGLNLDGGQNSYSRVISVHNNTGDVNIELVDCDLSASYYPINIGSGNTGKITLTLKGCTVSGYCAMNVWNDCTVNFIDCELKGDTKWIGNTNQFATIKLNAGVKNFTVNMDSCSVYATQSEGAAEYEHFYAPEEEGATRILNLDNVKFFKNGVEGDATFLYDCANRFEIYKNGVKDVSTADSLVEAINGAGEVSLGKDIALNEQIVVTNDLTIYGDGKTITQSSTSSNKAVIRLDGATEDVNIKLDGLKLDGGNGVGARVISVHNNTGDVNIVLENCTIDARHYPINIGSGNTGKVTVTIKDCTITGYSALNIWADCTINIENSTLIGVNHNIFGEGENAGVNNFATIAINGDVQNVVINLKDSSIKSVYDEGGAIEKHFQASTTSSGTVVNLLNNVKFFVNDVEGDVEFLNSAADRIVINK